MIFYLDQNYASRMAKHILNQPDHEDFGKLYRLLMERDFIIPPSSIHALEIHGSYLRPTFEGVFESLSKGYWFKSWKEILEQQCENPAIEPMDALTREGNWDDIEDMTPFQELLPLSLTMDGLLPRRIKEATGALREILDIPQLPHVPIFLERLAQMLAFRTLNPARQVKDSDLPDMIMAATVHPYVSILATDRFVREALSRLGLGEGVYSARKTEVRELLEVI